mmetsp:Transcript_4182/g.8684  ORF Transcript_4182/g.8684 Transcript_4182/m.8684 type:complete len:104 (+) Transcript_4182:102-413(+)|eukprot:CAMPEP_0197266656 /NCGR_PEP_ID=MMETSP1432-20130617/3124_1 /TAXON_ID=44447 /ORGANISM="Pseudo-nitzschia delicatissima, Strain UNC1205" /LENGTH=103 /DNA_ID=CAMNT_0042731547 /DNA_START=21 /DNA_END=332 /DNA_ORIENTATION=-
MVKYLQDMAAFNALIASDKLVIIDFTATWCPPCRMIAPIFEKMAEDNPDVDFAKVDVDEASDIASFCEIQAMPTFKFYKGGKCVKTQQGADPNGLAANLATYK